jgi:hypothetical protein
MKPALPTMRIERRGELWALSAGGPEILLKDGRGLAYLEALGAELSRAMGLGGRDKRAGSAAERARINVQRRLRDVIRRASEVDRRTPACDRRRAIPCETRPTGALRVVYARRAP